MMWPPIIEPARRKLVMLVALALLTGAILVLDARPAHAETTFVVNSTSDEGDHDTTDNSCFTGNTRIILVGNVLVRENECTLRAAIQQANATADADTIDFSVSSVTLSTSGNSEDAAATGDLDITDDVTIDGGSSGVTVGTTASFNDRIFHVVSPAEATVKNVTVTGGEEIDGGGIYVDSGAKLDLIGSTVQKSTAIDSDGTVMGGGIYSAGTLTITKSTVSGNTSKTLNSGGSYGGGLAVNGGTATITDSTFAANETTGATGSLGGGIYSGGDLTLANVTVSGNYAYDSPLDFGDGLGGGISSDGDLKLINATLNDNAAPYGANLMFDGVCCSNPPIVTATISVKNTIVASPRANPGGDVGDNCSISGTVSSSHSLEYPGTSCRFTATGDIQDKDPKLGSLADNGGPTKTHALFAGSPAIDAADNAVCPSTDQRGVSRPKDGDNDGTATCDIGAFERATGIIIVTPLDKAAVVARNTDITATFSEERDPATLTATNVKLYQRKNGEWRRVTDVEASCDSSCTTVTIDPYPSDPSKLLAANKKYKIVITPGVEDKAGNPLDQNPSKTGNQGKVWTFSTGSS